jgi:putative transposase
VPAHIVQRGNCLQALLHAEEDDAAYLHWSHEGSLKHGCQIHAYVLMTNHGHLLMTPQSRESISRVIQFTGRYYVS